MTDSKRNRKSDRQYENVDSVSWDAKDCSNMNISSRNSEKSKNFDRPDLLISTTPDEETTANAQNLGSGRLSESNGMPT